MVLLTGSPWPKQSNLTVNNRQKQKRKPYFSLFSDFRDFLANVFIRYLMGISPKYMQNVIRQYQTLFYRKLSHAVI